MRRAFVSFVLAVCVLAAAGGFLAWALTRGAVAASGHVHIDWQQTDRADKVTARVVERLASRDGVADVKTRGGVPPTFTITLDDSVNWYAVAPLVEAACEMSAAEYPHVIVRTEVYCYVTQTKHLDEITDRVAAEIEALPGAPSVTIDYGTTPTLTATLDPSADWHAGKAAVEAVCRAAVSEYPGMFDRVDPSCYIRQGGTTVSAQR